VVDLPYTAFPTTFSPLFAFPSSLPAFFLPPTAPCTLFTLTTFVYTHTGYTQFLFTVYRAEGHGCRWLALALLPLPYRTLPALPRLSVFTLVYLTHLVLRLRGRYAAHVPRLASYHALRWVPPLPAHSALAFPRTHAAQRHAAFGCVYYLPPVAFADHTNCHTALPHLRHRTFGSHFLHCSCGSLTCCCVLVSHRRHHGLLRTFYAGYLARTVALRRYLDHLVVRATPLRLPTVHTFTHPFTHTTPHLPAVCGLPRKKKKKKKRKRAGPRFPCYGLGVSLLPFEEKALRSLHYG